MVATFVWSGVIGKQNYCNAKEKDMAFYIKVSKAEADKRGLCDLRNTTSDGGYLLWQEDLRGDCPSMEEEELRRVVGELGGLVLNPQEAREERVGASSRALPKVNVSVESQPSASSTSTEGHSDSVSHEVVEGGENANEHKNEEGR